MKTRILILLLALAMPLGLCAEHHKKAPEIVGVWQQVQKAKHDNRIMTLPVWKVIASDGTFCTFLIGNSSGKSVITNEGRYEVTSDSTVIERVKGSITDIELIGKAVTLTYRFEGRDKLHVRYRLPGASRDGHETWVRVKLEVPSLNE